MSNYELDYIDLVQEVIRTGEYRECRNGETRALFGKQMIISELKDNVFPILTQRKIHYQGVLGELAAFLRGATKIGTFKAMGCNYWDANAKEWPPNAGLEREEMSIGQVYGAQWVNWRETGFDQLTKVMEELYGDPHSRRHVITAYDPLAESCLPPCHLMFQFFSHADGFLDIQIYMRSIDIIHGLPSDVVLYAGLLILVANHVAMRPGRIIFNFGDLHIYENHQDIFQKQHLPQPMHRSPSFSLAINSVFDFVPAMLKLDGYEWSAVISYPFNV